MMPARPLDRPAVTVTALGLLAVAIATVPAPDSTAGTVLYVAVVALCAVLMTLSVRRVPSGARRPWRWLLASQYLYLTGETLFAVLALRGEESWPTVADLCYLLAYVPVAVGLLALNRQRSSSQYRGSLLDASILALSAATLFGVFVILPTAQDGSQPLAARLVSSAYPVCDVLLVFLVARLVTGPGQRPAAFWLLILGTTSTIVADVIWNLQQLTVGGSGSGRGVNLLWLLYYVGFAAGAAHASSPWRRLTANTSDAGLTAVRLLALAVAAVLPSAVLVAMSLAGRPAPVAWLAAGSVALIALVVARLWDLLQRLRQQSRRLDALARTDPLTGIANRRTLEHELGRTCRAGRDDVFLALIDLDHFKRYNDRHGHQAGDELLKAATAAWVEALGQEGFLARWGGEEFVAVLRGEEAVVRRRVDALRVVIPDAQTCSIGLARWQQDEAPETTLRRADTALYAAKAAGRDRLVAAAVTVPG